MSMPELRAAGISETLIEEGDASIQLAGRVRRSIRGWCRGGRRSRLVRQLINVGNAFPRQEFV